MALEAFTLVQISFRKRSLLRVNFQKINKVRNWSFIILQIERKKVDHMKLAENVVFTLPVSDASKMTVEGNLLNEDGEMILEIGAMNVNLIKVNY